MHAPVMPGAGPTVLQYRSAALLFFVFVCGTNTATPLYPLWQDAMSASNAMTSAMFAIYPIGVTAGLLFGGRVADQIGRRPVMAVALFVGLAATLLFMFATRIEHILAGRVLFGVSMGLLSGPAASTLIELHPTGDRRRGSWQAAITTLVGPVFGIVPTSLLIWATPTLQDAVFITFSVQFVAILGCIVLLATVPESFPGTRRLGWKEASYSPQRISLPRQNVGVFLLACGGALLSWSATSTWLGLAPGFILNILHWDNKLIGLFVLVPLLAGGVVQIGLQRMDIRIAIRLGLVLAVAGLGLAAFGLQLTSVPVFVSGMFVAGLAIGFVWMGSAELLNRSAPAEQRASIFSFLYIVGYLGSASAVWGSGLASDILGVLGGATVLLSGLALMAVVLLAWDLIAPPDLERL